MEDEMRKLSFREKYADAVELAIQKSREREREERARSKEKPKDYTVRFSCYEDTFKEIATFIHSHPTWNRSYCASSGVDPPGTQERLPLEGGDEDEQPVHQAGHGLASGSQDLRV